MKAEEYVCPHCNCCSSGPVIENMVRCASCREWFPAVTAPAPVQSRRRFGSAKERVRWNAVAFSWVAVIFAAVAVWCLILGLVQLAAQGDWLGKFYLAGCAAGAAILFYVISQIIHIRACLEK